MLFRQIEVDPQRTTSHAMRERMIWSIYGLRTHSEIPFPFSSVSKNETQPDLAIYHCSGVPKHQKPGKRMRPFFWRKGLNKWVLQYHFVHQEILELTLDGSGTAVHLRHSFRDWRDLWLFLLGIGFGSALYLRGKRSLHGAAVVVDNAAILFVGDSGAGKSTIAALLAAEGNPFVCDDLAAINVEHQRVSIFPGHPLLKMDAHSAELLGFSRNDLRPVFVSYPEHPERWLDAGQLSGGFFKSPILLKAIYFISKPGTEIRETIIYGLSPSHACTQLTQHLYGKKWLPVDGIDSLRLCSRIARLVTFRQICLPKGLENMSGAAHKITKDIQNISPLAKDSTDTKSHNSLRKTV